MDKKETEKTWDESTMALIFDFQRTKVALIQKKRAPKHLPELIGKWNAIGGHIDPMDTDDHDAVLRELSEEAGIELTRKTSVQFGDICRHDRHTHCTLYTGAIDGDTVLQQKTDEPVQWHFLDNLPQMTTGMYDYLPDALDALEEWTHHLPISIRYYAL